MEQQQIVAYFTMEIALETAMPTYSGGLGVLAGDTIRSAADLRVPMVAVTLLHRKGYFHQRLDDNGWQHTEPEAWGVEDFLKETPARALVKIEGRVVHLRAWKYEIFGNLGHKVPVYFLDADLPENSGWDRKLTDFLYGGDQRYRFCQEAVLGIGGVRMLRELGYENVERFHMNEGQASLLTLELLDEELRKAGRVSSTHDDVATVQKKCVFTTHTPVPAGHDQFPLDLVRSVLEHREYFFDNHEIFCCEGVLNMTFLGFNLSHYLNGVAKKHGEVSQQMFASYKIDSITNGVHAFTWVAEPFQELYDRHIWGWEQDNFNLRYALSIPRQEIWQAHTQAKQRLIQFVHDKYRVEMDAEVFTIGFARRAATYKRADLLFTDIERLKSIAASAGPLQLIYAGKAHPQDQGGKEIIQRIFQAIAAIKPDIKMVYLENYNMELGKLITTGVDLWLNTPQPPLEASGTSGMKAALNGVPSLSVLDGWWIEGHIEGITGWSIGENGRGMAEEREWSKDAASLYDKLEGVILPLFYGNRESWLDVMRHVIALNGSFFNTQRMLQQYVLRAYFL